IYVMGCLSQRYREDLIAELPEVDGWYGKFDWVDLASDLTKKHPSTAIWDRRITTPKHHAYIKIAEGCNRFCSFCAIPLITGRFKSRPVDEILDEVTDLVERGVKEFNVIAQDLSSYGTDLYGRHALAELIDRMSMIPGVEWIRLHYAYPADFPWDVLDVMNKRPNVCKYLDVALQHCNDKVLSNMRRHIDKQGTVDFLKRVREKVPGIHLRTTLMVGFPGEDIEAFEELKQFVSEQRFERMGAFAYCEEDDTYGAKNFTDDISDDIKEERLSEIMAIQEEISLEHNTAKVGQRMRAIVDSETPEHYIGRTEFDSPEVDPEVLIEKATPLSKGEFVEVEITGAMPFELLAKVVK
ncbi:MAG: 30S ribosomal protein S12 methylthiotransferase RimO, partial [Muribaculaceae bacterium]|nr:30S ribosomal protein S12 methylthiotransferase RimO [Muribaculaceae bacterium]